MSTWQDNLVLTLRVLIGDFNAPQKNTDTYLESVLVAAGILVDNDVDLSTDYVFDIYAISMTPDPVEINDTIAQALLPLKAACILNQSQFQTALGQGIKVRDGDSQIDTSVSFVGYRDILKYGPCASYESLKWQIQSAGAMENVGSAVYSPYRGLNDNPIDTITWFYDDFIARVNQFNCRR